MPPRISLLILASATVRDKLLLLMRVRVARRVCYAKRIGPCFNQLVIGPSVCLGALVCGGVCGSVLAGGCVCELASELVGESVGKCVGDSVCGPVGGLDGELAGECG